MIFATFTEFIGVGISLGMLGILFLAIPIAERERAAHRRRVGLPPAPTTWQLFQREMRQRRDRAEAREGITPLLGHTRIGLDVDQTRGARVGSHHRAP